MMGRDAGFTLAEMMVALLILSAMAVSVSAITGNILGAWARTDERLAATRNLYYLAHLMEETEQAQQSPLARVTLAVLITDDGRELRLAEPKIEEDAACVFDLVGRRCR